MEETRPRGISWSVIRGPLLVFVAVFAVRAAYWAALEGSPLSSWYLWRETDEHTFLVSSERIAKGNWLDVPAYRPYHVWQRIFAPPEVWEGWYQKNAYFQGPGYTYFLALVRLVAGFPVVPVRVLQLLFLGSLTAAAVTAFVARRLERCDFGERLVLLSSALAGLVYGLYGPLVFHDGFLYRDGPVTHLSTCLLILPLWPRARVSGFLSLGTGLLGGIATLLKQTVLPLGAIAVVALAISGGERRRKLLALGFAGLFLPLVPLAVRNHSVGAPLTAFDTRQQISLVWGSARGADGTPVPSPILGVILNESEGSTAKTVRLIAASWKDDPWGYFDLELRKLITFFHVHEIPDNASYYFFADRLSILSWLPVFACVVGVGLAGLAGAVRGRVLRRWEFLVLLSGVVFPLASCLLVSTTSRYRTSIIGVLAAGIGFGLPLGVRALREGRRLSVLASLLLAASFTLVAVLPPVVPTSRHRFSDAMVAATLAEALESPEAGYREVERYVREGEDDRYRGSGLATARAWILGQRWEEVMAAPGVAPADRRYRSPGAR
ncbi:MAG: hypothetical protein DIJKHBIC_02853 [Thermoanaerobaculia bacterium]|nr:hypothetical protein [Thermoanaerobaculia bacterium]